MAKGEATLLIRIKEEGAAAFDTIADGVKSLSKAALGMGAAMAAIGVAAGKLASDAENFNDMKEVFDDLAKSHGQNSNAILDNMRKMSKGIISDNDLIKMSNQAMLKGIDPSKLNDMMAIARGVSKATGESMQEAFEKLSTGLSKGSNMILQSMGISVNAEQAYANYAKSIGKTADQLSETEKKQVLMNAAMKQGLATVAKLDDGTLDAADSIEQLKVNFSNAAIKLGQALIPYVKSAAEKLNDMFKIVSDFVQTQKFTTVIQNIVVGLSVMKNAIIGTGEVIANVLGKSVSGILELTKGNFSKAAELMKEAFTSSGQVIKDRTDQAYKDIYAIVVKGDEQVVAKTHETKARKIQIAQEEQIEKKAITDKELIDQIAHEQIMADSILAKRFETNNAIIASEASKLEKLKAIKDNEILVEEQTGKIKQQIAEKSSVTALQMVEAGGKAILSQAGGVINSIGLMQTNAINAQAEERIKKIKESTGQQLDLETKVQDNINKNIIKLQEEMEVYKKKGDEAAVKDYQNRLERLNEQLQLSKDRSKAIETGSNAEIDKERRRAAREAFEVQRATALANAAIQTAQGILMAIAQGGPLGIITGAVVGVAAAAQVAAITSQQPPALAEGGIVLPRPGGTLARIGEAGEAEAVIPLSKAGGMGFGGGGTTVNITVNGGLLGDEFEARKFAVAIDKELMRLRQSNMSLAFDRGIV